MAVFDGAHAVEARFDAAHLEDESGTRRGLHVGGEPPRRPSHRNFLQRAVLREARLDGAEGDGVEFRGADLRGACLAGAKLDEADFRGADLRGPTCPMADSGMLTSAACSWTTPY